MLNLFYIDNNFRRYYIYPKIQQHAKCYCSQLNEISLLSYKILQAPHIFIMKVTVVLKVQLYRIGCRHNFVTIQELLVQSY